MEITVQALRSRIAAIEEEAANYAKLAELQMAKYEGMTLSLYALVADLETQETEPCDSCP